ncbi:MAG: glycerol-3-phosphate acyltransferase [Anaerolineales bacterium]|nr:glycerol-3-phosphate acyltransferase [Anaerolineales bacterium]MCB0006413.1 glycerol-3-phosphate acyltransferase [Anaerolineales bacterium]MCB0017201.1 glycerol-3-phosphate acyltransferase [Anaerolineales bacterium]MCB0026752.1 glycerol-3-phosphate acyltransferase [Anaerolineales bacterium]MCB8959250.1 glycerol-3-phosphate acyltransferase [Ardenticatenales bacterium]
MSSILYLLLAALIGYIAGSIPNGFIMVKLIKGIDIREVGSGRTGGTNSMRAAGFPVGFAVSIMDVLKGALGVWVTQFLLVQLGVSSHEPLLIWAQICAGIFSVVGHNWSIFLGFRGGAGTGPNVGWATAIWWPFFPISLVVMPLMLVLVGMASLASIVMGVVIPVFFTILYFTRVIDSPIYILGGLITLGIVLWALRPNIGRMLRGEERLVGPRARRKQQQGSSS